MQKATSLANSPFSSTLDRFESVLFGKVLYKKFLKFIIPRVRLSWLVYQAFIQNAVLVQRTAEMDRFEAFLANVIGAQLDTTQEWLSEADHYLLIIVSVMATVGLMLSAWRARIWWCHRRLKKALHYRR